MIFSPIKYSYWQDIAVCNILLFGVQFFNKDDLDSKWGKSDSVGLGNKIAKLSVSGI